MKDGWINMNILKKINLFAVLALSTTIGMSAQNTNNINEHTSCLHFNTQYEQVDLQDLQGGFFDSIGDAFSSAGNAIADTAKRAVDGAKNAAEAVGETAKNVTGAIGDGVNTAIDATGGAFNTAIDATGGAFNTAIDVTGGVFIQGAQAIEGAAVTSVNAVGGVAVNAANTVGGGVLTATNATANIAVTTGDAFKTAGLATGGFFANDVGPFMQVNWPMFAQIGLIALGVAFPELQPELNMIGSQVIQMGVQMQANFDPAMRKKLGIKEPEKPAPNPFADNQVELYAWNNSKWETPKYLSGRTAIIIGDFGSDLSQYGYLVNMVKDVSKYVKKEYHQIIGVDYNSFAPLQSVSDTVSQVLNKIGDNASSIDVYAAGLGGLILRSVIQDKSQITSKFDKFFGFAVPNEGAYVHKSQFEAGGIGNYLTTNRGAEMMKTQGWDPQTTRGFGISLVKDGPEALMKKINEKITKDASANGQQASPLDWQKDFVEKIFMMRSTNDFVKVNGNTPAFIEKLNSGNVPENVKFYFCGFNPFDPAKSSDKHPYLGKDLNDGIIGINSAISSSLNGKGGFNADDKTKISKSLLGSVEINAGRVLESSIWPHALSYVKVENKDEKKMTRVSIANDTIILQWVAAAFSTK